ncbi:hypothetical protein CFIICLFH_1862 [Methylobacterium goesingense]|uniref:Uncharacterized protein n=1 Tax=Methylobacterium goesingense TaxID=243690 RepID=A0ABV2LBT5_9HYPH|nr:hypothetical protein CFIICLFH_1862 [Methylobacterium goesingense]
MSKKVARATPKWGGGAMRRRRQVRPHILRAARRAFGLALIGILTSGYLLYCLCHIGLRP